MQYDLFSGSHTVQVLLLSFTGFLLNKEYITTLSPMFQFSQWSGPIISEFFLPVYSVISILLLKPVSTRSLLWGQKHGERSFSYRAPFIKNQLLYSVHHAHSITSFLKNDFQNASWSPLALIHLLHSLSLCSQCVYMWGGGGSLCVCVCLYKTSCMVYVLFLCLINVDAGVFNKRIINVLHN